MNGEKVFINVGFGYLFVNGISTLVGYDIYQPLRSSRIWHKVNFYAEFNRFEFNPRGLFNAKAIHVEELW